VSAPRWSGRSATVVLLAATLVVSSSIGSIGIRTAVAEPLGPRPAGVAGLAVREGLSVVLVEASTGQVLVEQNADARRPVASAIKLATALTVIAHLPEGSIVRIGTEVVGIEGSSYDLRPGEVRDVDDLLAGLLLRSGNDAAVALAVAISGSEEAFIERMTDTLGSIGVTARPGSSSGLDVDDALTARELAAVSRAALAAPRLRGMLASMMHELQDGTVVENRNLFLLDMPDATGLKTGFTSAAGFTLAASARRDGRELIAVVLGAIDDLERRAVAARLLEHGFGATRPVDVERSVSLRTARGPVRFATVRSTIVVDRAADVIVEWPSTLRPEGELVTVALRAGDSEAGSIDVVRLDGRQEVAAPSIGRALADGVYAAMRPGALAGSRTTSLR
jgi:D-alanyl-D-alanine carboxypeptidase (penicillin-binding protein 5/6)